MNWEGSRLRLELELDLDPGAELQSCRERAWEERGALRLRLDSADGGVPSRPGRAGTWGPACCLQGRRQYGSKAFCLCSVTLLIFKNGLRVGGMRLGDVSGRTGRSLWGLPFGAW